MGRTARFDQIYVANLDAQPIEEQTLTGVTSILTREIEADEIVSTRFGIGNAMPYYNFSLADKVYMDINDPNEINFQSRSSVRARRVFADEQVGIGTTNPTSIVQVYDGEDVKVNIDIVGKDLATFNGNVVTSNLVVNDFFTCGPNVYIRDKPDTHANIIEVIGSTSATNLFLSSNLHIGPTISLFGQNTPNVAIIHGNVTTFGHLRLYGNIEVAGNISVTETATYTRTVNLIVDNSIIASGFGNEAGLNETGFLMTPGSAIGYSNVAMGFTEGDRGKEIAFFQTDDFADVASFTVDDTKVVNVHVYGDIYTAKNIGAHNTYPTHDLCIGSNVFFDDIGSNVMHAMGNIYATGLRIGNGGLNVGSLLTMRPGTDIPVVINGNVQMSSIRTTDVAPSGIANLLPTDTLSIGDKVFINVAATDTITIVGNTHTTNLHTDLVYSYTNVVIHADRFEDDTLSNSLTLMSGPTVSNVSAIEVYGASKNVTLQNIRFKTKNVERMRIDASGNVGISNTNPSQKLTVNGNVYIMGSNVLSFGNTWGTTGNISMRAFCDVTTADNKIQNIVGAGKGLKIYVSSTGGSQGTPVVTVKDTSNVGINTENPLGRLHTSGGTVFINDQPQYRRTYNHLNSSLVVTNTNPIVDTTDLGTVMHLTREGNATRDAVRSSFQMGKYDNTSGESRSKLNISLADVDYTDDVTVMSLLANGKVGIGHTQPSAFLEVKCEGIGAARSGGLLVHNHDNGDAIISSQTSTADGNAFSSYMQTDGVNVSGWSVGVSGANGNFRINQNPDKVSENDTLALFIDGSTRGVGINTDVVREALEVNGNVVVGKKISFSGFNGDEYGNTHIIERRYNQDYSRTELLLIKGNDSGTASAGQGFDGPDRIRHIAGEHVFQVYEDSGLTTDEIITSLDDGVTDVSKPLIIRRNGVVVIGGTSADGNITDAKLVVKGDIKFIGGGSFKLAGLTFSTTSASESLTSRNVIRCVPDLDIRRPLTFVHELIEGVSDSEFARFDENGRLGMGTTEPTSNIHVYDTTPTNIDLMRLESAGNNKQTGLLIYTNPGEGGYIKGFSNTSNKTTGLVMGVANNSTMINCVHLIHSSNVGIGTHNPSTRLHIFNGDTRIERSSTSNVNLELKSSAGISTIRADQYGNVHVSPRNTHLVVDGGINVRGDLIYTGQLQFGNQIGVNLQGAAPATNFHVRGGMILESEYGSVRNTNYSNTFSISSGLAKNIQLTFNQGAFYADVTAVLRKTDGGSVTDVSTIKLELQGGTSDASLSTVPIALGKKSIFGGASSYPWSPDIKLGKRSISILPYNLDTARVYAYDIYVQVISACGGKLLKITSDLTSDTNLDNGVGGQTLRKTFTY